MIILEKARVTYDYHRKGYESLFAFVEFKLRQIVKIEEYSCHLISLMI